MTYKRGVTTDRAQPTVPAGRGVAGFKNAVAPIAGDPARVFAPALVGATPTLDGVQTLGGTAVDVGDGGGEAAPGTLVADPPELAPDLVAALGGANAPGVGNPVATLADVSSMLSVTRAISSAELLALATEPIELLPAVAGRVYAAILGFAVYHAGQVEYVAAGLLNVGWPGTVGYMLQIDPNLSGALVDTLGVSTMVDPISAPLSAGWVGEPLFVYLDADPTSGLGPAASVDIADGGADYAVGDTGHIDGIGDPATYIVDTVDGAGAVLTLHLTDGGSLYSTDPTPLATIASGAQPGIGTGLTVVVTTAADGTVEVTVFYREVDVS